MFSEFRAFIQRGNVIDLAVGVIIGAAFGGVVTSLVNDLIMPPIGLILGNLDFRDLHLLLKQGGAPGPYTSLAAAKQAGAVTLNYGQFVNTLLSFLIVGLSVFLLVRAVNRVSPRPAPAPAPATRDCPFCCSAISLKATRCPHCTSEIRSV
jgi:large conductance mechanosensitive channel